MKKYLITLLITISLFVTTNCSAIMTALCSERTTIESIEVPNDENWFIALKMGNVTPGAAENDGSIFVNDNGTVTGLDLRPEQNEAFIRGTSAGIVAATPSCKFIKLTRAEILEFVPDLKAAAEAMGTL